MNRHERRAKAAREHKAQHFIAQSYSRAWCDPNKAEKEEPYVWLFDRDGPTDKSPGRRKSPANVFHETDMYTIRSTDAPEERDLSLEKQLSRIESEFCTVRRDFVEQRKRLGPRERVMICAFAAAQLHRTPGARERVRQQWAEPLSMMRELTETMKSKTSEEKRRIGGLSNYGSSGLSFTMEQVETIVDQPLQTMMGPQVNALTPTLAKLNLSIMCTETKPGFITSDEPCVVFDPEAYKRPLMFQSPGLAYPSVEVTLPLSPRSLVLFSHQPYPQYFDVDAHDLLETLVNELNRRTCRYAREKVVVNRKEFRVDWANNGKPLAERKS